MSKHLRNFDVAGQLTEQGLRVTKSWPDPTDAGVLVVQGDIPTGATPDFSFVPSGAIMQFAGAAAPTGWLLCDGTTKLTADYPTLYAAIGYTYGGSGSSFGLPNIKGKIPVGRDAAQTEFATLGQTGGEKTHILTTAEMPSHTHVQNAHTHVQNSHNHTQDSHTHALNGGIVTPTPLTGSTAAATQAGSTYGFNYVLGPAAIALGAATATNQAATAVNQNATATNQNAGGDGAHNNLQPYIVLNYIIKT
jgi:microcystin-dependent protein